MPARNIVKTYVENGYYHVYNRGVEGRKIFLDEQDCRMFLYYIKMYLTPVEELKKLSIQETRINRFIPLNLSEEISLLAFALMPNHIHIFLKQYTKDGITKFMQRLSTGYVMYFNKKYKRLGGLFQNTYKGVLIDSEIYFLHLSRYIHINSSKIDNASLNFLNFSSYPYYLGKMNVSWVKPKDVLDYFKSAQRTSLKDVLSYQSFVEDYVGDSTGILQDMTLEDEC